MFKKTLVYIFIIQEGFFLNRKTEKKIIGIQLFGKIHIDSLAPVTK